MVITSFMYTVDRCWDFVFIDNYYLIMVVEYPSHNNYRFITVYL